MRSALLTVSECLQAALVNTHVHTCEDMDVLDACPESHFSCHAMQSILNLTSILAVAVCYD